MISNNQWNKSHLGKLGKVRPKYNDPWPKPITKMDIKLYQHDDNFYQHALEQTKQNNKFIKNKKRLESDSDYLENQNMYTSSHFIDAETDDNMNMIDENNESVMETETIDLAKYYGLDNVDDNINVDNDRNTKDGVVYDVLLKSK